MQHPPKRPIGRRDFLTLLSASSVGLLVAACAQPAAAPSPTAAPKTAATEPAKAAATAAPAATSAAPAGSPAAAAFDWKKHSGKTIRVLVPKQPGTDFVEPLIPEFEKLTGMKVSWEKLGEDQQRQKLQVELTSGMAELDIFGSHAGQQGKAFLQAGWYEPLDAWVKDAKLTDPAYDFADWDPNVVGQLATVDSKLIGMLMFAISFPLYYRKDLFQAAGLQPPKTMEEMEAAAKKLTDKAKTQFGMLLRGQPAAAVGVWPTILHNFGSTWLAADGKAQLNSADSVASIDYYGRMAREYGPPGVINLNWPQLQELFQQERGAMFIDTSVLVGNFEDPKVSKVAGKVGYVPVPMGKAQVPALNGWMWSMYAKSKNKEAAWYFIQWASGKDVTARLQRYGISQARKSVWQDKEFQAEFGSKHPDLVETMQNAYAKGKAFLYPPFVNVAQARDLYGEALAAAIQGQDAKAAAEAAQVKLLDLQKKEAAG
ncbi:MAG: ABC transporter substrate-binding protein [Chloroflexota bacterium]